MHIRFMIADDVPQAASLYVQFFEQMTGAPRYPSLGPDAVDVLDAYLRGVVGTKDWFGVVAETDEGAVVGAMFNRMFSHPGDPRLACRVEFLGVAPGLRRTQLGNQMMACCWAELQRRRVDVVECNWTIGSISEHLFPRMGMRGYQINGVIRLEEAACGID